MQRSVSPSHLMLMILAISAYASRTSGVVGALSAAFNGSSLSIDETRDRLVGDGWGYGGNAIIQNDELVFANLGEIEADDDILYRDLGGYGSFRLSTVLGGVDLGNYQLPFPESGFNIIKTDVTFKGSNSPTTVSFGISEIIDNRSVDDNTQWAIGARVNSSVIGELVPKTRNTMEFELTYSARRKSLVFRWDANINDSIPPSNMGTLTARGEIINTDTTFLTFQVLAGEHTKANARLQSISVTPLSDIEGDFSNNQTLDIRDVNTLSAEIHANTSDPWFDLDLNNQIDSQDLQYWIHNLKKTYYGDANLDGEFNSADLVEIFATGKYEDGIPTSARWESGDWNADLEFDTSDLVVAFQDGGYEQGPMQAAAVPEVVSLPVVLLSGLWCLRRRDRAA